MLFATPKLPHFVIDSMISSGSPSLSSSDVVQPPVAPYLDEPGSGVGLKPSNIRLVLTCPYVGPVCIVIHYLAIIGPVQLKLSNQQ